MNYIGKGFPIHDAESKARGLATFAGDIRLHNMAFMALYTSPYPHAVVKRIDCSEALEVPGVITVLHCFNTTEKKFSRYKRTKTIQVPEQERVFTDHPLFVGDRIAAVLANDAVIAHDALSKIRIEFEELPYSDRCQDTLNGVIDGLFPEGEIYSSGFEVGTLPAAASTDKVIDSSFHIDRVTHIAMENHACVASYDDGMGELTIWSPNQSVYGMRYVVANFLDMPMNKIRLIKSTMGGSFGGKQECVLEPVVAYVSRLIKRPVSLTLTRRESMISTVCRAPVDAVTQFTFSESGKLKSVLMDVNLDSGAYLGCSLGYVMTLGEMAVRNYHYPYLKYSGKAISTNMPVSGGFRGWSTPECTLIVEHAFDQAAKRLGMDPVELRLMNVISDKDIDPITKAAFDKTRIRECLIKGRDAFRWAERHKSKKEKSTDRFKIGVGMACGGHVNGHFPDGVDFSIANMRVDETGTVNVNVTLHDHGCGTVRVMQIIAGEVLGISPESIHISEGDTFRTPEDVGCYASRTTHVIGAAVKKCAEALVEKIVDLSAKILNISKDHLVYKDGAVFYESDPQKRLELPEIAEAAHYTLQESLDVTIQHQSNGNPGVHGVHFAQVSVDVYTGMVSVQDYLAVQDIGRAINPKIVKAQIQRAVQMGCGIALTETMTPKNKPNGRTVDKLRDYHVLTAAESPNMDVILVEDPSNYGPFGAKGVGEVCFVPVAATIVSAVNDALGSELNFIPLTPDKIMKWINEQV